MPVVASDVISSSLNQAIAGRAFVVGGGGGKVNGWESSWTMERRAN